MQSQIFLDILLLHWHRHLYIFHWLIPLTSVISTCICNHWLILLVKSFHITNIFGIHIREMQYRNVKILTHVNSQFLKNFREIYLNFHNKNIHRYLNIYIDIYTYALTQFPNTVRSISICIHWPIRLVLWYRHKQKVYFYYW